LFEGPKLGVEGSRVLKLRGLALPLVEERGGVPYAEICIHMLLHY